MLTPAFDLSQDDNYLILTIKAPYCKISETEVFFEGKDFKFYSKPYFLRLNLPGSVEENGKESATYNADEGSFLIRVPKASPGEWFEGLDLQTKLLAPKKRIFEGPLVEVVGTEESNFPSDGEEINDEDEFDWEIYQNQYTEDNNENILTENTKYGFACQKSDVKTLSRIQEEMPELLDVRFPHLKTLVQRREERILAEETDFSDDHYLADMYEEEEIQGILAYNPPWLELEQKLTNNPDLTVEVLVCFTEEEKTHMRSLPNKEYLLDHGTKHEVLLSLVDILFAYAYNVRATEGDNWVESPWTICKLSATLSWLETFSSLESVVVSSVKRSLCYPLHRQWNLALTVLSDTAKILLLGKRYVLKCLLEIRKIFSYSEPRYILNDLYITDYCVWIQSVKNRTLLNLAQALKKVSITKEKVGLDIPTLEHAAELVLDEEKQILELPEKFENLQVGSKNDSESESCDGSIYEDSESESDSSSLDSDDYSSSENEDSSNEESDDSDSSGENCLLLKNIQSVEKVR